MSYLYSGSGNSTVYMASYTPNYAGVYLVMALPVVVILTITAAGKAGRILAAASALSSVFVYMEAVQEPDWQLDVLLRYWQYISGSHREARRQVRAVRTEKTEGRIRESLFFWLLFCSLDMIWSAVTDS